MSPRGPSLDDLIRAQRVGTHLTDAQRGHNRARLLARVVVATGAAAVVSQAALTAAAVSTTTVSGWGVKVAVALVLASGAGAAYVPTRPAERKSPATQSPASRPPEAAPPPFPVAPPEVAPVAVAGAAAPPVPRPRVARRGQPSVTQVSASLAAEVELLHAVDAALRAGQPQRALALLDGRKEGDGGLMNEERAAARVVTLCRLGRVEAARDEAARFLRDRPRSPLAARVRATCAAPVEGAASGQVR